MLTYFWIRTSLRSYRNSTGRALAGRWNSQGACRRVTDDNSTVVPTFVTKCVPSLQTLKLFVVLLFILAVVESIFRWRRANQMRRVLLTAKLLEQIRVDWCRKVNRTHAHLRDANQRHIGPRQFLFVPHVCHPSNMELRAKVCMWLKNNSGRLTTGQSYWTLVFWSVNSGCASDLVCRVKNARPAQEIGYCWRYKSSDQRFISLITSNALELCTVHGSVTIIIDTGNEKGAFCISENSLMLMAWSYLNRRR